MFCFAGSDPEDERDVPRLPPPPEAQAAEEEAQASRGAGGGGDGGRAGQNNLGTTICEPKINGPYVLLVIAYV